MKRYLIVFFILIGTGSYGQTLADIETLLWDGNTDKALQLIDVALKKSSNSTNTFLLNNKKAEALIRLGQYGEAKELLANLDNSVPEKNQASSVAALNSTYGLLYLLLGRYDLSEQYIKKSLGQWTDLGKIRSLDAAQTQSLLGNLFRAGGKYAQAEEHLLAALQTRLKLLSANHELVAASYNDLGLVFSTSDTDKALDYYEKALTLYIKVHGEKHPKIALARTNIGYLYHRLELYGDAINNFESALSIWKGVYKDPHPTKAFVLFNLGNTHEKMGKYPEAKAYYENALAIYIDSYHGKHPDLARVYNALGNLELSLNKFDDAMRNYQLAITANILDFSSLNVMANPKVANFYDGNVLLYSLLYKAQASEQKYFRQTLSFGDLRFALRTLHTCDTLIDKLRQQINSEQDKISLGTTAHEVYTDGVRIAVEAAANAWDKNGYYNEAFFFAEKSKAAVLLGAISDVNAKAFAGIPQSLLDEENALKSAIALCAQKLAQKPDAAEEMNLREKRYDLNRKYEAFSKRLEANFPAYFNLKYNSATPSIRQLQNKLPGKTLLVSYFLDEKNQRIYLFEITKNKFRVEERSVPNDFDRNITGLRNSLMYSEVNVFTKASENLAKVLLPHIPGSITDLVIIPTGRLSIVPFETLLTRNQRGTASFATAPYLISHYSVRYELSSGLILQKTSANTLDTSILLCAPVDFNAAQGVPSLPGSAVEVKDIAELFNAQRHKTQLLLGQDADEHKVKRQPLKDFSFIHLATHGVVDEEQPELSRIYLRHDKHEDGNLYAGEIYNLQLNAHLVTLSACQTGLGKISKGEGVIGLSRALVYAGARNSLVSFWNVGDESTSIFMRDFYKILLKTESYDLGQTLAEAKRNLIKQEKYSSPYYWAPFILIGF